jgi:hypothetical protein
MQDHIDVAVTRRRAGADAPQSRESSRGAYLAARKAASKSSIAIRMR